MNEESNQNIDYRNFVPPSWFLDKSKSSIWVSAFRVVSAGEKIDRIISVKASDVAAVILPGILKFFDVELTNTEWKDDRPLVNVRPEFKQTNKGLWLLIITPFKIDGQRKGESEVRSSIAFYAGFFASFLGRNTVYEKIFDNIIELESGDIRAVSPAFANPFVHSSPVLSKEKIEELEKTINKLETLSERERNRIKLALNWYFDAINDSGKEAFIKSWIAIEILAMPDTTNIKPIKTKLSEIYDISIKEVQEKFSIGRLFGLRSRIVHDGEDIPIHYLLEVYVQAIFVDLLYCILEIQSEHKAEQVLSNPEFDLDAFLHVNN